MDEPYVGRNDSLKVTVCLLASLLCSLAALVGWVKFGSLLMLFVFPMVGTVACGYLRPTYTLAGLLHFALWCAVGRFLHLRYFVVALLALSLGLALTSSLALLAGLFSPESNPSESSDFVLRTTP